MKIPFDYLAVTCFREDFKFDFQRKCIMFNSMSPMLMEKFFLKPTYQPLEICLIDENWIEGR